MSVERRTEGRAVERLVADVLNRMAVTEIAYHDFDYTRPLVSDMVRTLRRGLSPGARVLVIGSNSLLAEALIAAGYRLELWRFGQNVLADELAGLIGGRIEPETLAAGSPPFSGEPFDAILLPLILEHVPAAPGVVIGRLAPHLRPGGTLVIAAHNLGSLGRRLRALRGRPYLPPWRSTTEVHFSLNWPDLPAYRWYLLDEVVEGAQQAGMHLEYRAYRVGHRTYHQTDFFGIRGYLALLAKYWVRLAVPPLREYSVLALTNDRAADVPVGWRGGDNVDA